MATVTFDNATRLYPGTEKPAVDKLNIEIADGEFLVLVGPSGCGKSTSLRMLAGLEDVNAGRILIGDRDVTDVPPKDRDIAMVFQNYALYPHMTVADNMGFALKIAGVSKEERAERVREAAKLLDLEQYLDRKPKALSGGQRQRVAMGRAIVRNPQVFLMDEPLSNLDAKLRVQMRLELKDLHRRLRTTSLYVTHDQVEAMTLADRMMVLNGGRVEQIGTPLEVYSRPASTFVAGFIGSPPMNLVPVSRNAGGGTQIRVDGAKESDAAATLGHLPMGLHLPERALMGLRPEHIESCSADEAIAFIDVRVVEALGADAFAYGALAGHPVVVRLEPHASVKAGDKLPITASAEHLHWFDPQTTRRIEALA